MVAAQARALLIPAAAAAAVAFQLFIPPSIGLADNGDFPRVAGRLSLCPEAGWDRDRYHYFVARYRENPACYWDSGIPSSEMLFARLARALDRGPVFDIRTLGALQSIVYVAIMAFLPAAAFIFFTDVGYVSFFNSFYMDSAALVFCLATIASALRLRAIPFIVSALLLVTSKSQHAWLAVPLGGFLIYMLRTRVIAFAGAAMLLGAAIYMTLATPLDYKASNLWNSVFATLLTDSATPMADLQALGLGPEYAPYIGRNSYQFPDMATAEHWMRRFYASTGYLTLFRYYAVRPRAAVRRMWRAAARIELRPLYLGNYQHIPDARTSAFGWWSGIKGWIYHHAPWLALAIYAAAGVILWRSAYRPILILLLVMALIEFLLACFADSIEDYRHFFLFHVLSDALLCAASLRTAWLPDDKIRLKE